MLLFEEVKMSIKTINEIEQLERELIRKRELNDPENRKIIHAYTHAQVKRLDEAVYAPLEKKYPSLNGFIGEIRKVGDVVAHMLKTKSTLKQLNNMGSLTDLIEGLYCKLGRDADLEAIKEMSNRFEEVKKLDDQFSPIQEQYWVDIAHAVKEVSTQRGVKIEEIVMDLQYTDEISRIVIPTRKEAESFLRTSNLYAINLLIVGKGIIALAKKAGTVDEEMLQQARLFPTKKALEAVQKATWDYKMQEYDRIYSAQML